MSELAVREQPGTVQQRHAGGRPTVYSQVITQQVCERIRKGIRPEAAAVAAGIHMDTYYAWMRDNEEFSESVNRADAEAEATITDALVTAATDTANAKGDGKLCVEWLKRRRRGAYGDVLDIRKVDSETLMALLKGQADAEPIREAVEPGEDLL